MKNLLILSVILHFAQQSFSCCGAGQHRLFPIGTINNKVVSIYFMLSRDCSPETNGNNTNMSVLWSSPVNLVIEKGDTLELLQKIDSFIKIPEGVAISKTMTNPSGYYNALNPYFDKAFNAAQKINGFKQLEFVSIRIATTKKDLVGIIKDSFYFYINGKPNYFNPAQSAVGPVMHAKYVREYKAGSRKIYVLTATEYSGEDKCIPQPVTDPLPEIKSIAESFYYDNVNWHGYNFDYIFIK